MTGEPPVEQVLAADASSSELCNQLFLLGDDVREAALGVAGIEAFLVEVQGLLSKAGLCEGDVDVILAHDDTSDRLDELEDALGGLRRSLLRAREALAATPRAAQPIARVATAVRA